MQIQIDRLTSGLRDLLIHTVKLEHEAADSVHASLAEDDISDERRNYRRELEQRLRADATRLSAITERKQ